MLSGMIPSVVLVRPTCCCSHERQHGSHEDRNVVNDSHDVISRSCSEMMLVNARSTFRKDGEMEVRSGRNGIGQR